MEHGHQRSYPGIPVPKSVGLWLGSVLRVKPIHVAFVGSLLLLVASQSSCEKSKKRSDPPPVGEESEEGELSTVVQPSGGGRSARPSASVKPIAASSAQEAVVIEGLQVLAAKPGEVVEVTGSSLQAGLMALIGNMTVDLKVESATKASFVMPQGVSAGLVDVDFKFAAQDVQRFSLISDSAGDNLPIMLIDPSQICQDISYRDAKGEVKQGQRLCQSHSIAACSADGATGCVANSTFPAVNIANFVASDVKAGKTVAGVAGALNNCLADGGSDCVATLTYRAALTTGLAPKVVSGHTVAGVAGSAIAESHSNCTMDGGIGCVTVPNFRAADMTRVGAGNIKSGVTIAGVTGAFPSASYPLPGADATTDLDFATFDARIKNSASFEWFDSSGIRYTNSGDADIQSGNIANGVTIFGATGTLANGSNCTADGQINCITNLRYRSMDTDVSVISSWDIRKGKTAGGLAGEIVFYKNMANTAVFNRTSGSSALAGVDIYDTIDDYNNNNAFPAQNPTVWDQATGANWLRDSTSDDGAGGGIPNDGICNGTEICVYRDRITGLYWRRDDVTSRTWEAAINYCEGLTNGGFSDWRLPTQKDFMQAYANGLWSQKSSARLNLGGTYYWSSTTRSDSTSDAWMVHLSSGDIFSYTKSISNRVLCVR